MNNFFYAVIVMYGLFISSPSTAQTEDKKVGKYQARIEALFNVDSHIDSVFLYYYNSCITDDPRYNIPDTIYKLPVKDQKALFVLPMRKGIGYFSLFINLSKSLEKHNKCGMLPIETGDDIQVLLAKNEIDDDIARMEFKGNGSQKLSCMKMIRLEERNNYGYTPLFDSLGNYRNDNFIEKRIEAKLKIIQTYKGVISKTVQNLLIIDTYKSVLNLKKIYFKKIYSQNNWQKFYNSYLLTSIPEKYISDKIVTTISASYPEYVIQTEYMKNYLMYGAGKVSSLFDKFESTYSGELRDKIVFSFINRYRYGLDSLSNKVRQISIRNVHENYQRYLNANLTSISEMRAKSFDFKDINGNDVKLEDFFGKVVFIDFWFTGCTHCKSYFKNVLNKVEDEYKNNKDVVFISISIDRDFKTWKNSVNSGEYTGQSAINLYTAEKGSSHPAIKYYNVKGYPNPLLIDKNKKIVLGNKISDYRREILLKEAIDKLLYSK